MKTLKLVALVILTTIAVHATAQDQGARFSFELNAGPAFSLQDLGNTDLQTGLGFEGILHYRIMPHVGVYAGWGWNKFAADETFQGIEADFEETGYLFGLQFKHPIKKSNLSWFVRGGGLYNHIEVENNDGDIVEDTGHGLGYHVGSGLEINLSKTWRLSPLVTIHSLSRDLDTVTLDLRNLSTRVGIVKFF
jgi:hypothetical protein